LCAQTLEGEGFDWHSPSANLLSENGRMNYLPSNGETIWAHAGYQGYIPDSMTNIINIKNQGAVGDGITDDYGVIQSAINNASPPAVLFFHEGTYRINTGLVLREGVVICGEGHLLT